MAQRMLMERVSQQISEESRRRWKPLLKYAFVFDQNGRKVNKKHYGKTLWFGSRALFIN
jgi:hypothetical protein